MKATMFLRKVMNMRKAMIARGHAKRDVSITMTAMNEVQRWMKFWNPTEDQVRSYIKKKRALIELIMPGLGSTAYDKLWRELEEICA